MSDHEDLRELPWFGGNKIPQSYLRKFSGQPYGQERKPLHDEMPLWMQREIEREFGK